MTAKVQTIFPRGSTTHRMHPAKLSLLVQGKESALLFLLSFLPLK